MNAACHRGWIPVFTPLLLYVHHTLLGARVPRGVSLSSASVFILCRGYGVKGGKEGLEFRRDQGGAGGIGPKGFGGGQVVWM